MSEHLSKTTTNHQEIRKWAEDRGAKPTCVRGTGGKGDVGMIRLDFPGYTGEGKLEPISWDEFFKKFDENKLALVYQEHTASGEKSNFNKLVSRESGQEKSGEHKDHPSAKETHGHSGSEKTGGGKTGSEKTSKAGSR